MKLYPSKPAIGVTLLIAIVMAFLYALTEKYGVSTVAIETLKIAGGLITFFACAHLIDFVFPALRGVVSKEDDYYGY